MSSDPSLRPPSDHAAPSSSTIAPPAAPPPPPPVTTSLPSPGSLFKAITTCHPSAHAGTFQAVRLQLAEIIKSNEGEALLLEPVPLADGRGVWPIDAFDHHVYSLAGLYYLCVGQDSKRDTINRICGGAVQAEGIEADEPIRLGLRRQFPSLP